LIIVLWGGLWANRVEPSLVAPSIELFPAFFPQHRLKACSPTEKSEPPSLGEGGSYGARTTLA
jgi:hypothetical protein